jgi:subtilisin family serine protease
MRSMRRGAARVLCFTLVLAGLTLTPAAGASGEELVAENAGNLWLVELKGSAGEFRAAAKTAGIKYTERAAFQELWNGVSIVADASQLAKLESLGAVKAVFPNLTVSLPASQPDLNTATGMTGADIVRTALGYDGTGIKVAVMDTGIDWNHPDLGGCFGPGCKVATGWDFVGDAFNASDPTAPIDATLHPDPNPDDCNGHGTHVSGIVGANGRIKGAAPGVTLGAYRVFGCNGNTTSDVMIAAMERVLRDKMDVLNMSIGAANNNWPQYPTAIAATRLAERGVKVVASIGNSGPTNLYSAGAPGVGEKVIGTAAFDNTRAEMYGLRVAGVLHPWGPASNTTGVPPLSGTTELTRTGTQTTLNDGCGAALPSPPNPAGLFAIAELAPMAGKVALIRRGTCGFYHKALAAQRAGASAVILYNNQAGRLTPTVAPVAPHTDAVTIPVVFISQASGNAIDTLLASGPQSVTWTDEFAIEAVPTAGTISSFSSWGLAADLSVKPDIGAPGGNILSTYPLEKTGYANIGGTSMASPHVAGAVALLLQAKGNMEATQIRTILQNSADPKMVFGSTIADAVHRQGAGMLDVDDAIRATTLVSPGKLSLGEGLGGTRTLTIRNASASAQTYTLSHLGAASTNANTFAANPYLAPASSATFSQSSVTVPAGGSANVDVTITPALGLTDKSMYSGYVLVADGTGNQFSVPYAGFKGDYQSIAILNGLLALGRQNANGTFSLAPAGSVFTLANATQIPNVLAHLDHQVRTLQLEIRNAATGLRVHDDFPYALDLEYQARSGTATSFFALPWDGMRSHDNGGGNGDHRKVVPDGTYTLTLKVLKPLGDAANPAHWETWTSPAFTIDRP